MAQQINRVTIGGNLTTDPELRSLPSGTSVCKLRIANNRRWKNGQTGEWQDRVGFYDVTVWGAQGENCARYLSRGRPIMVAGELQWREWETPEGQKRSAIDIKADEVQFLSSPNDQPRQQGQDYAPHPMQQQGFQPQQAPQQAPQQGYSQQDPDLMHTGYQTAPPPHQDPTAPVGPPQTPAPGPAQQGAYGGPPQQVPVPPEDDVPF